jgi:ribosomal protein S18 acetylase RimI-like enzyme
VTIRPLAPPDRDRIHEIVRAVGNFNQLEVDIAMELVDDALSKGDRSDYIVHVLEVDGIVYGYLCFGKTPLTDSTYDLYWMAVDPACQGRGYGREILRFAEEEIVRRGGTLLLVETSSQESYRRTSQFYETAGYRLVARIPDFYRKNDDKLIYIKSWSATG